MSHPYLDHLSRNHGSKADPSRLSNIVKRARQQRNNLLIGRNQEIVENPDLYDLLRSTPIRRRTWRD